MRTPSVETLLQALGRSISKIKVVNFLKTFSSEKEVSTFDDDQAKKETNKDDRRKETEKQSDFNEFCCDGDGFVWDGDEFEHILHELDMISMRTVALNFISVLFVVLEQKHPVCFVLLVVF